MSDIVGVPPCSELEHISVLDFRIISTFVHDDKAHAFEPHDGPLSGSDLKSAGPVAY